MKLILHLDGRMANITTLSSSLFPSSSCGFQGVASCINNNSVYLHANSLGASQARAPRSHNRRPRGERRARRYPFPQAAREEVEEQQKVVQTRQVEEGQEVAGKRAGGRPAQVQEQQV